MIRITIKRRDSFFTQMQQR